MSATQVDSESKVPASILILFTFWVLGTSVAMFLFQGKDLRLFYQNEQQMQVFFEGGEFSQALNTYLSSYSGLDSSKAYVFHFWNPDCTCDQANSEHVRSLITNYSENTVFFVVSSHEHYEAYLEQWLNVLPYERVEFVAYEKLALEIEPPATPAVAVVQASGKMNYFGPYSEGGVCLPNENGIVEGVLDSIFDGKSKYYPFTSGYGCYCPWKSRAT
ncbi:hypothetical protein KIH87_16555 [Paraneptunicella aestuarii]|uniref:DUF6436 domain-containing protein n=1 Tax=Paraneptunicella aestuarii TaxID=2831148 RepID=UPI001E604F5A|nr:DUF6436 domain-containing protein [Paraneptunicella aestuarii]UAA38278.1 hypothetical protein KIH87_16555 [Paraneptunicella aestuarii]